MTWLDDEAWRSKVYIDGWTKGGGGDRAVTEPATGDELGRLGVASPDDVAVAAERARQVQRAWASRPYTERAAILRRAGDLCLEHVGEIGEWLVREGGGSRTKSEREVRNTAQLCFEAAALASHPYGDVLRSAAPRLSFSRRLPVGVVGVISPFNVPFLLAMKSIAPALALGNAVIAKPDLRTGVSGGVAVARLLEEAGVPARVLSMLPGGADVGEALVAHPAVRVVSFTGSTHTGRAVAMLGARHLTRVHLELGGNSALVVLDDVDVERASSVGAFGSFSHQGQICMATGRHIVDARIYDDYVSALAARADRITVGDPARGDVALGPLIDEGQKARVDGMVTGAVDAGALLVAGGTSEGLFYRPTVLAAVPTDAPAWADEIFGPVAPVRPFDSVDEAIELACDTEYGLSFGVLASDTVRALEIAGRVPSGAVHINDQTVGDEPVVPFGGVGISGAGSRIGGLASLDAFTETQWVTLQDRAPEYPF